MKINYNEGGRGLVIENNEWIFYVCYWTKWFAPRFSFLKKSGEVEVSCDP